MSAKRFQVALSFPGEKRNFIREVAEILSATLGRDQVLYDDYLTAELARPNLDLYLGELYRDQSELLVPFFCADYERKKWCKLEWRQMRDILFNVAGHRIMPFRFDDVPITGMLSIDGYVTLGDRSPKEVAELIIQRLGRASVDAPACDDDNDSIVKSLQRLADLIEAAGINDAVRKLAADSLFALGGIYADAAVDIRPMTDTEKLRFETSNKVSAAGGQIAKSKEDQTIEELELHALASSGMNLLRNLEAGKAAENVTTQLRRIATELQKRVARSARTKETITSQNTPTSAKFAFKTDISRILKYAPDQLIGREEEMKLLNDAWHGRADLPVSPDIGAAPQRRPTKPKVLTFVALGGEGKTSLVAKWAAELAHQDWPGCDAAFAWSFYSQGTREQMAASSDLFLKEALTFFGDDADKEFAASPAGAFEKGQHLARIVGQRRSLLILDGLEPLQYAPTSPTPGQLKDQGIAALLKGLAAASHGLCVVTTRYSLPDLKAFWQATAPEVPLLRLSRDAGVHLLKTLGVRGTAQEFETLVEDVKGHALTLTLLGGFLQRAFHGDIRQRDRVKFEKADEKMDGGHAFRTMAAYEQWLLRDGGDEGRREVAVLRLMGLFDRPADAGCLAALRSETIPGLTEPLAGLADDDWEFCLTGLETAKLLTVNRDSSGALVSLDAHPHLREYFARQLRAQQPDAWRAAHRRLYEHLCATTPNKPQPTLEDLQPLYQAVAHGCQAGLQQEACERVFNQRIRRGRDAYSHRKLGAFGSDLGAITCFFETPWSRVSAALTGIYQAWLLNESAFSLRALGRLTEALEPLRATLEINASNKQWKNAAIVAENLSEAELTLGRVTEAVAVAQTGVKYADQSREESERVDNRTTHADALHQAGRRAEAETRFGETEQMQKELQPDYPLLYSAQGFQYCDLLLVAPERAAWQTILGKAELPAQQRRSTGTEIESCHTISQRAAQTLKIAERNNWLLVLALDHLTLARAALYAAILERSAAFTPLQRAIESAAANEDERRNDLKVALQTARGELDAAVAGLRRAASQDHIPRGLLTRACLRFLTGARTGPESAQEDLDEAWEIAERGPMKLFLADIHLHRARLFGVSNVEFRRSNEGAAKIEPYPWESPAADLADAEKLINDCGYHRRDEELADAKLAILGP